MFYNQIYFFKNDFYIEKTFLFDWMESNGYGIEQDMDMNGLDGQ